MTGTVLPSEQSGDAAGDSDRRWSDPATVGQIAAAGDPVVRNLQITQAYHELSLAMARLTGAGANWCTVATWASKQAGQSIRREDLAAAFERLLRATPEVETRAGSLLEAGAAVSGYQARSLGGAIDVLWDAVNPAAAFERTSDAVARGNRKVFEEIGGEFARFLSLCAGAPPSDIQLEGFLAALRPGEPPEGQRYLRQAFRHYTLAMRSQNPKEKAELLLLANLEIGFHEQTRLQPEILEAMNAPVVDPRSLRQRLVAELFPDRSSRIRYWLGRLAVTANLMTLTLPGPRVLRLGRDLPDRFPEILVTVGEPELLALLQSVDVTPNDPAGTAVVDWGNLPQRMHFIADLFRTYHLAPALFDAPFAPAQVAEIGRGLRPQGPL